MKRVFLILSVYIFCTSYGPPNCNLYKDDKNCFEACKEAEKAVMHGQGARSSQQHFDKSIELCPTFDYSFYEKSVPFAKRGLIKEWKILIDEAVRLNPKEHLANRGWYHFFFLHNYEDAIRDIEKLDALLNYDIGLSGDGIYHLNVLKGLSYKGLGDLEKAKSIIENQIRTADYDVGLYDYLHLGVLYLETGQADKAIELLEKQKEYYDLSEVYFYIASAEKERGNIDACKSNLQNALAYYDAEKTMHNSYRQLPDEIYKSDIEAALANVD